MLEAPKVERVETETAVAGADQTWRDPSATCECNRLLLPLDCFRNFKDCFPQDSWKERKGNLLVVSCTHRGFEFLS